MALHPMKKKIMRRNTRMMQRRIRTEGQLVSIKIMNKTMSIMVLVRNGAGSNLTKTIHHVTPQSTLERIIG